MLRLDCIQFHISHINKVVCITVTGIAFVDLLENGGEAVKLGNYIEQSYNIAQRKVYETESKADGSTMRVTKTVLPPDGSTK